MSLHESYETPLSVNPHLTSDNRIALGFTYHLDYRTMNDNVTLTNEIPFEFGTANEMKPNETFAGPRTVEVPRTASGTHFDRHRAIGRIVVRACDWPKRFSSHDERYLGIA